MTQVWKDYNNIKNVSNKVMLRKGVEFIEMLKNMFCEHNFKFHT